MPDTDTIPEVAAPVAELLPASTPQPKPKRHKPTAGEGVTELLESHGLTVPPEERAKLLETKDDAAMMALLEANLGDGINVKELKANSVFSSWMFRQIVLPPMLLTLHLDNLAQAKLAIDYVKGRLKEGKGVEGGTMTHEECNNYIKTLGFLIHDRGAILLKNALNLALLVQGEPEKRAPKATPRNRPPDSLSTTNVAVQVNLERKDPDNTREVEADTIRQLNDVPL